MRQLSGSEAYFLYADKPGQPQHLSTVYLYDQSTAQEGKVRFKSILEHMRDRLKSAQVFRSRLVHVPLKLDYPYWLEDPNFQLEYHVRHIALPAPGDWKQFCTLVSRLHSRPLDLSRPVWEMYVIEGLDRIEYLPPGSFAVFTKIHHAAIDEKMDEDFTFTLHDAAGPRDLANLRPPWRPDKEPGNAQLLALAWLNNTVRLLETGQTLWDRLPFVGSRKIPATSIRSQAEYPAPLTRFDQPVSPHRVWLARWFRISDVNRAQKAVPGAELIDVVIAICGGALRLYLEQKNELPEKSLHALLPRHVQANFESDPAGHQVQFLSCDIGSDLEDPLARLEAIVAHRHVASDENKVTQTDLEEIGDALPSSMMSMAARAIATRFGPAKRFREHHNTIINLIPGPDKTLYLCGAKLMAFSGMPIIMDHLALNHTVTLYAGKLAIAAVCDRQIMPDPEYYGDCLERSFAALRKATNQAASGNPKIPKRRREKTHH